MPSSWIEIDREALLSNVTAFRSLLAPECRLMVVVKANAYGHDLGVVAPVVAQHAGWLGVNSVEEALAVEGLGLEIPVAILGMTPLDMLPTVVEHGFRQVVFRSDAARGLAEAAARLGRRARIHIKIETGTNRLGVPLAEIPGFLSELARLTGLDIEGMYTHFANIEDTLDPSFARVQLERFQEALKLAEHGGIRPPIVHTAASAGVLLYPETHFSMVRVGIGAYGIWPSRETRIAARERKREVTLRPVLSWKTRVAQVKSVRPGDTVGYGLTYRASRAMRLAVLPVGYFDGYDRKLSNTGRALVRGHPVPVVGRVAMNMIMLDVTDVAASEDDEVVLLGRQGGSEVSVEELAEKSGTIPYETLCRIHPGLPRVLV